MTATIAYRGFDVSFLEYDETWTFDPNNQRRYKTLKAAKEGIDTLLKEGRKIADVPVIVVGYRLERKFALASRWDGDSVWVTTHDRSKRWKERADKVLLDTPKTRQALEQSDRMILSARALCEEAEKLVETLPRITQ